MADDLGLLAAHGAARGARGADRDLDLPKSAATSTAVTDRQLRQPVRSAAVRITVRISAIWISAITWTVGIAVFRIAGTVGYGVGRQRANGVCHRIACYKQQPTLEAIVSQLLSLFAVGATQCTHLAAFSSVDIRPGMPPSWALRSTHLNAANSKGT